MRLPGAIVVVALTKIAVPPRRRVTTSRQRVFAYRVVEHGAGLKIQPGFALDPELPQLRQQVANSS
jgi:hypothetical protein